MSKRINTITTTSSSFKSTARLFAAHAALLATLAIAAPAHAGLLGGAGGGGSGGAIGGSLGGSLNGSMSGLQRPELSRTKDKLAEAKMVTADKAADGKTQGGTALAGVQDKLAQAKDGASTMPAAAPATASTTAPTTTPSTPTTAAPAPTSRSLTADATGSSAANRDGASANGSASVRGSGARKSTDSL